MAIAFRNEKDRYKIDASVVVYLKVNQVTEKGITVGEEKMWYDFYTDIIGDNLDKLNKFIADNEKEKKETLKKELLKKKKKRNSPKRKLNIRNLRRFAKFLCPIIPKNVFYFILE